MDTSGFYKLDKLDKLLYAPNFVYAPEFSLTRKEKDTYQEPVGGWKWFNSEKLAKIEYKISVLVNLKKVIEKYKTTIVLEDEEEASLINECMAILSKENEAIKWEISIIKK